MSADVQKLANGMYSSSGIDSSSGMATVSVAQFLSELRQRDIRVWADDGQLKCSAKPGVLDARLREQLKSRKAAILDFLRGADSLSRQQPAIVPLQPRGAGTPIFAVGGHNGDVFTYRALVQRLGAAQPFYGLQPPGLDAGSQPVDSIESLAAYFTAQIKDFHGDNPVIVGGFCAGGTVAIELARQLRTLGTPVKFVALFGCPYPTWFRAGSQLWSKVRSIETHAAALARRDWAGRRAYVAEKLHGRKAVNGAGGHADSVFAMRENLQRVTLQAVRRYGPEPFRGRIALFLPNREWVAGHAMLKWRRLATEVEEYWGPAESNGDNMLQEPHAEAFARLVHRAAQSTAAQAAGQATTHH